MKKNSLADYIAYTTLKLAGPVLRKLPLSWVLFFGRSLGRCLYYFDCKHRAIAYANIKKALGANLPCREISALTKGFYERLGMSIFEIFLIPLVNQAYIDKYIEIEGREYIDQAFSRKKGVILLGAHGGSWELNNVVLANLGFNYNMFVRDQKMPRLNRLLNTYRQQKNCKLIQREKELRGLILAMKDNEAIGMTVDQGGKNGMLVDFFGRNASMASGALRIALKYKAVILPAYYVRKDGPYQKIVFEPPFELERSPNEELDIKNNLARLVKIFEKNIRRYPKEYLWTYKIWKYSTQKQVLILSDKKAGHQRQSEAVARIIREHFLSKGKQTEIRLVEVNFNNKFIFNLSAILSGRYSCQGRLESLRRFIEPKAYTLLENSACDVVVSCGSSMAPVNFLISRENAGKSIVLMRPSIISAGRFDLAIIPRHDSPPKRKNIVVTEGALNLIDASYLKEQAQKLIQDCQGKLDYNGQYIGVLIGGDAKGFRLGKDDLSCAVNSIKKASIELRAGMLLTTSRRTSPEAETVIKNELKDFSSCKLLIIANEKNIASAVGGILGLSNVVVTTPESISMISESLNSEKYVIVINLPISSKKHQRFINNLREKGFIHLVEPEKLGEAIIRLIKEKPVRRSLEDNERVKEAVAGIL